MSKKPPPPEGRPSSPRFKSKGKVNATGSPKAAPTMRDIMRQMPTPSDLTEIESKMDLFSDQNVAIILPSVVDRYLELAIISNLKRNSDDVIKHLTDRDGALGGFFAKIHLAYALGLFNINRRNDLDAIRRIRNCFAHSAKPLTFETPEIMKESKNIKRRAFLTSDSSPRDIFVAACSRITGILIVGASIPLMKKIRVEGDKRFTADFLLEIDSKIEEMERNYQLMTDTASDIERKIRSAGSS